MRYDLDRLRKIGKACAWVMLALTVLCVILAAMFIVVGILIPLTPDFLSPEDLVLDLGDGYVIQFTHAELGATMAAMGVLIGVFGAVFRKMGDLLRSVGDSPSPFDTSNADCLAHISVLFVAVAVVGVAMFAVVGYAAGDLGLTVVGLEVALPALVMALITYCLAIVFGYGAALQKESDETL